MTAAEMHTAIGLILDDPNEDRWLGPIKDQALNASQYKIVKNLPNDLLTELQQSPAAVTVPALGYALSGLTTDMIPGGFCACNVVVLGGAVDLWSRHIWIDDMEFRDQNDYMKGSDTVPISYIFAGKFFILLDTYAASNCILHYIGQPSIIEDGVTDCGLDVTRHDLVVAGACAELLRWEGQVQDAMMFDHQVGTEIIAEIQAFEFEKKRRNRG